MRQTLLALAALMTAALLNLNQMQSKLHHQKQVVRSEVKQMALGVAMQTMEVVRTRAFDENTRTSDTPIVDPGAHLVPLGEFPEGMSCEAFGGNTKCKDIEDFNEMKTAVVPFQTTEVDMEFTVDISVRYVNEAMQPCVGGSGDWPSCTTVGPTFRKEVIIEVQDKREDPYLVEPIQFSEVISYY